MEETKKNDDAKLEERKRKIISFLKTRGDFITYGILAIIIFIALRIRTRNLSGLRDVTTGQWTLGPDLDPFLFLRWAKNIVENGSLMAVDMMRYVPLGFETKGELILLPYLIAWFHKITTFFGRSSVEQSAALFPVFMFGLTVIAFFLFSRKIFEKSLGRKKSNYIALVASLFLSVLPPLLPRTIAGIPEKESAAFFFLFISFYFFLNAWESNKKYAKYLWALLAGVFTAGMALIWGGFGFIFFTIGPFILISYILGVLNKQKVYVVLLWTFSSLIIMSPFSTRYSVIGLSGSTMILIIWVSIISWGLEEFGLKRRKIKDFVDSHKLTKKIPIKLLSIILTSFFGIIFLYIFSGPKFILEKLNSVIQPLITPITSRLGVTVAENRQPFFGEIAGNFGPAFGSIQIFFWIFFAGSVYLFFNTLKPFDKKEKFYLAGAYLFFLSSIYFGRLSQNGSLNGTNALSLSFYILGLAVFVFALGFYYYKYYNHGKVERLKNIDSGIILLFSLFLLSSVSARGAVRLIMILVPPASIIASYFVVSRYYKSRENHATDRNIVVWIITGLIVLSTIYAGYQLYQNSSDSARGFVPSSYNQQWQRAMSWIRDNTPERAVLGHWWDYGYWVQSIGERSTILDGGNAIPYWNHLMGRHALTGSEEKESLNFLYAHNATHFLIDSTDIGKYTAFSSIGSDESYDRRSWLNVFQRDNSRSAQTKNSTLFLYLGGTSLDEDIITEVNGTRIFLPGLNDAPLEETENLAALGGILLEIENSGGIGQPRGIYIYQGRQIELPLKYAFFKGERIDFGSGIEAGVFLMSRINQNSAGINIEESGALIYLSKRTVNSQLAKLYLYGEETDSFKIAHVEEDIILSSLKSQGFSNDEEIVFFQGIRGPIKIWEIIYPKDVELKGEYLNTDFPNRALDIAR